MPFAFFQARKAVIAMAHIGALPGSPLYEAKGGMNALIDGVVKDVDNLQAAGVDAIMFGNENDRPYLLKATPESLAAMTAVVSAVKPLLKVPFGVNYLWDPTASVAIAAAPLLKKPVESHWPTLSTSWLASFSSSKVFHSSSALTAPGPLTLV